ncbi:MAG: hypothetical protein KDD40_11515, partial [Bdellovibrionales bacterium]|nr:hypothetical protein [Bdellovibrionales bacterium]
MRSFFEGPPGWMKAPVRMTNGALKDMGIDPVKMMLSMCDSPAGSMGASMFNSFGQIWPGTTEELIHEMKRMMYDPRQVVRAIDCASNSLAIFSLMENVIYQDPQLLYFLGAQMVHSPRVARAIVNLASQPLVKNPQMPPPYYGYHNNYSPNRIKPKFTYPGAELLLSVLDPLLFNQLTYAMHSHPQLLLEFLNIIEKNKKQAFAFKTGPGSLTYVMMSWGSPEHSYDGSEIGMERFIYLVLANVKAANQFFSILESLDKDTQKRLLDVMFIGRRFSYNKYDQQYTP